VNTNIIFDYCFIGTVVMSSINSSGVSSFPAEAYLNCWYHPEEI